MKKSELRQLIKEVMLKEASNTEYDSVIAKLPKMSYSEIIKYLDKNYKFYLYAQEKDIPFGSGAFEQWLEKKGVKITDSDISKLDEVEIGCLLTNIFYNSTSGGLKKMISDSTIKKIVDSSKMKDIISKGIFSETDIEDESRPITKYVIKKLQEFN